MIIQKQDDQWVVTGTATDRVYVLKTALQVHEESYGLKGKRRRSRDLTALSKVWSSGLFNLSAIEEMTGVTRKTLRIWLDVTNERRPYGRIKVNHLQPLINRLTSEADADTVESFIDLLVSEGSSERLVRAVLQKDKEKGAKKVERVRPVRQAHRPDDKGHPARSEGSVADRHTDQDDHRSGGGESFIKPLDFGQVQEPAARDAAPEPAAVEEQGKQPLDTYVDDEGRTVTIDEYGTHIIGYDWNPLDDFEFDETGDSLLQRGDDEDGSGGIPGLPPVGAPWEQAEEAES